MANKPAAKKGRDASPDGKAKTKKKAARKPGELSRFQKGVIILFVVIFALSTLAGALASVVQSQQNQSVEYSVDDIDNQFEGTVADLESKVQDNPDDADSLRSLADNYMQWGTYVLVFASNDDETAHANDLFNKAIENYDKILAQGANSDVSVNRAMCQFYEGDTDAAVSALQDLTASDEDYAPAWLNLGIIYQAQGQTDYAKEAYEKAVELDSNGDQGVKDSAEQRLSALEGDDGTDSGDDSSDESGTDDSGTDDDSGDSGSTDDSGDAGDSGSDSGDAGATTDDTADSASANAGD